MFSFAVQSPENENYCVCVTSEPTLKVRLDGLRAVDVRHGDSRYISSLDTGWLTGCLLDCYEMEEGTINSKLPRGPVIHECIYCGRVLRVEVSACVSFCMSLCVHIQCL